MKKEQLERATALMETISKMDALSKVLNSWTVQRIVLSRDSDGYRFIIGNTGDGSYVIDAMLAAALRAAIEVGDEAKKEFENL